ncbi:TMEM175 family protein [Microlunatus antarcticus]|uniref:Putative membrane protein n=1 Tax=Microlunatus antarcticus TaxID=53388 RepID=A0A7W5JX42_9ACTN|nr:putative membrane protein [Microlunatus antarcticus]
MPRPARPTDSAERLVFFTDAVVAIALTLLVLPLVDLVPEASRSGLDLGDLLRENVSELGSFLLSFVVIFRFWWSHHQLFRHVSGLSPSLVRWNLLWLLSIVFLPWPTAIITAYDTSPLTVLLYSGTLVVSTGSLTALAVVVHRDPALSAGRDRETRDEVLGIGSSFAVLIVALVLGTTFADTVNYWALLLLFATGPVERLLRWRWSKRPERPDDRPPETDADVR